jgi:hypothetical protein
LTDILNQENKEEDTGVVTRIPIIQKLDAGTTICEYSHSVEFTFFSCEIAQLVD